MKILESKPVTIAEAKEIIEKRRKDGELKPEGEKALQYTAKFAKVSAKEAQEKVKKILELNIPRLKEEHAVKIVDLMPKNMDVMRLIFAKELFKIKDEDMQKILELL